MDLAFEDSIESTFTEKNRSQPKLNFFSKRACQGRAPGPVPGSPHEVPFPTGKPVGYLSANSSSDGDKRRTTSSCVALSPNRPTTNLMALKIAGSLSATLSATSMA